MSVPCDDTATYIDVLDPTTELDTMVRFKSELGDRGCWLVEVTDRRKRQGSIRASGTLVNATKGRRNGEIRSIGGTLSVVVRPNCRRILNVRKR